MKWSLIALFAFGAMAWGHSPATAASPAGEHLRTAVYQPNAEGVEVAPVQYRVYRGRSVYRSPYGYGYPSYRYPSYRTVPRAYGYQPWVGGRAYVRPSPFVGPQPFYGRGFYGPGFYGPGYRTWGPGIGFGVRVF